MNDKTITLRDSASGAEAHVLAGFGWNCYRFRIPCPEQTIEVVWAEGGFEHGDRRPSASGIPVLFPYPGRLRGKTLRWQGRKYGLEGDDRRGNAIHGYVLGRPWRVLERSEDRAVGQFQASVDDAGLLECWPADFRLTATYAVSGRALHAEFVVENPDRVPLPCGLGLHPYFCVPLGGSSAEDCRVRLPFTRRWELDDMLPTGKVLDVKDPEAWRDGLRFGDMAFDDVFTGLEFDDGICTCRVLDPSSRWRLAVEFDEAFSHCVVFNPPHRQAVCIEPYTCVPNAPELEEQGVRTGLRILQPGQSFRASMTIRLESAESAEDG